MSLSKTLCLGVSALCIAALSACSSSGLSDDGFKVHADAADAKGVWASEGYGWIVDITDESFTGYEKIGNVCIENDELSGPIEYFPAPYYRKTDGSALKIMFDDPAYKYSLVAIDALPAACSETPDASPVAVFSAFDALFREHYAFFDERGLDWDAMSATARSKITDGMSDAELFDVLAGVVNQIDDGHVSLRAEIDGERRQAKPGRGKTGRALNAMADAEGIPHGKKVSAWRKAVQQSVEEQILGGNGTVAGNGWIRYGLIDGDIGYLSIMAETFYGETEDSDSHEIVETVLDDVMAEFNGAKAVILDISLNHGGEDGISRRIARRFTDKESVAYSKYAYDRDGAELQEVLLRPAKGQPSYTGDVYVLTSDHTVSAGEILTMSLKGLPNVTHIGGATRGSLSDILAKTLPNGWTLTLSNEVYADGDGTLWEGKGITPDVQLDVFSEADPFTGHPEAVRDVVRVINSQQ